MTERTVPADNFMATIAANVNNEGMTDVEFREFIRNILPIVQCPVNSFGFSLGLARGWSCNAGLTLEAITEHCIQSTGLQNVYMVGSKKYMLEVGREQGDGAICATIYKYDENDRVKRSGSLRIEGDGKVSRGPAIFKKIEVLFFDVNGHRERWRGGEVTQANIELEIERHIRQVSHQMKIVDWRKQWEQPERRAGSVRKSVWKNGRGRQAGGYQLRLVSEKTRFPTAVVRNTKGEILGEYKTPAAWKVSKAQ